MIYKIHVLTIGIECLQVWSRLLGFHIAINFACHTILLILPNLPLSAFHQSIKTLRNFWSYLGNKSGLSCQPKPENGIFVFLIFIYFLSNIELYFFCQLYDKIWEKMHQHWPNSSSRGSAVWLYLKFSVFFQLCFIKL